MGEKGRLTLCVAMVVFGAALLTESCRCGNWGDVVELSIFFDR